MTHIFDGREFARQKESKLIKLIKQSLRSEDQKRLSKNGISPKLVSIIVGEDPASVLYVNLKKKAAERAGCRLLVVGWGRESSKTEIQKKIETFNNDASVHGIMVQLPLPTNFSDIDRDEILNTISHEKDVDGLRVDSKFLAPTAKAILEVLAEALKVSPLKVDPYKVVVVGASGFIGRQIVKAIDQEYGNIRIKGIRIRIVKANSKTKNLRELTSECDVIISVVGMPDLIKADMVKPDVILIDVGAPKGDIEKAAYEKASFVSPVPGGVGPVTISCLIENLVNSAKS